jgi:holin-like protein
MVKGLALIFLFQLTGETIVALTGIPLPGNVIGMILLFCALLLRIVSLDSVEKPADVLIGSLGLFFIPPGVGLIEQLPLLRRFWPAFAVAATAGTVLTALAAGIIFRSVSRKRGRTGDGNSA